MGCSQSVPVVDQQPINGVLGEAHVKGAADKHPPVSAPGATLAKPAPNSSPAPHLGPNIKLETYLGQEVKVSTCPFKHGSVGAGPFPGYVHGANPTVCPAGCKPHPELNKYGYSDETPIQTLIREALEYQTLYHSDKNSPEGVKEARIAEILAEIEKTGTYTHTFDELQHGARCAWRNAPKCSNRKFWEELQLVDGRDATTPAEMFTACLEVLERATLSCVTTANIAVFRPQTPGSADGPRVWNTQLIRYAGFKQEDGSIIGDPAEADFTEMISKHFGWTPPEGANLQHTLLPVLLQSHPDEEPEVFTLPPQYVVEVPIRHPDNERISSLGLRWYAVPAVSCLELSVGGLTYTACPFNGWYADTEIVRNITDECRLNMCKPVARALGLDTKNEASLWRDRAIVEVDVAVVHSFREAGMGMADHTTVLNQFWKWYNRELVRRGYSPGNWKWIIPPISPTATKCYLQLNKMIEFTVKPGYWYAPGWRHYKKRWEGEHGRLGIGPVQNSKLKQSLSLSRTGDSVHVPPAASLPKIALLYASVTGNTESYAYAIATVLKGSAIVTVLNMEDFESDSWCTAIAEATLVLVLTSTYGPGAPPGTAAKFVAWLQASSEEAADVLKGKPGCVVGFGSSCYPRFCAAADLMHTLLVTIGARMLQPVTKADALAGEEMTVWSFVKRLGETMVDEGWMDSSVEADLVARLPMTDGSKPPPFVPEYTLVRLSGDGLRPAREKRSHYATVLEVTEVMPGPKEDSSTKLVRLDIGSVSCGNYYSGDEVSIWAENDPALVERFAQQLGIANLDEMFLLQSTLQDESGLEDAVMAGADRFPLPNSFRTVLSRYIGLSDTISFAAISALSGCAPEDPELARIGSDYSEYQAWVNSTMPRWADLFDMFPRLLLRVPPAWFFQLAPVLKPRYYSISSSSAVTPTEVAITVGLVAYTLPNGQKRHGFCSRFINQLRPGDRVRFKLVSQPAFRQPLNLEAPVVMVAAGTGLAPFRGFWAERALRLRQGQKLGPAVLVFGCRSKSTDFIYREALEDMTKRGCLTRLLTALSREPGVRKAYVQDVIGRQAELLRPMLTNPRCHVYMCGGSNVASEVNAALAKVAGKDVVEKMALEGRYHEDVFGITISPASLQAAAKAAQNQMAIKSLANADIATVLARLDAGLAIDTVDETASTLLHHAARNNRADLVAILISRKTPINSVNKFGLTPMGEAVVAGHGSLVNVMAAQGFERTSKLHSSFYPLHAAVQGGDLAKVEELLQAGNDPDQQDFYQVTPLHIAVVMGSVPLAEALLKAGASPNLQNAIGMTPLQLAVTRSQAEVAAVLQAHGADIRPAHIVSGTATGSADPNAGGDLKEQGVSVEDIALVKAGWAYVSGEAKRDNSDQAVEDFGRELFLALFDMYPKTLDLFPFKTPEGKPEEKELRKHGKTVALAIGEVIKLLHNAEALNRYVIDLVERHVKYGVDLVHYDIVLGTISSFVESMMPAKLSSEEKAAWSRMLGVVKNTAQKCYAKTEEEGKAAAT